MMIWEPRNCIKIKPLPKQNGITDHDEPNPLLNGIKGKEE